MKYAPIKMLSGSDETFDVSFLREMYPEFMPTELLEEKESYGQNARNFMHFLLNGLKLNVRDVGNPLPLIVALVRNSIFSARERLPESLKNFLSEPFIRAVDEERNAELLWAVRNEFQNVFFSISQHLQKFNGIDPNGVDAEIILKYQFLINNLLAIYAMVEPDSDEKISLPVFDRDRWVTADFTIDRIPLVSEDVIYRLGDVFEESKDQVYCYGLRPNMDGIQPRIIFKGTTFPQGEGKRMQDITNFIPDLDVGQMLCYWGRENVRKWLLQYPMKCHVSGASLGGILAIMFSMAMPGRFEQVYAINPPGFRNIDGIDDDYFQAWKNTVRKPNVYILSQQSDPVSQVGYFLNADHVQLYSVSPAEQKCTIPVINHWIQHLVIQLAHDRSILEPQSVEGRNQRLLQGIISKGCFNLLKPWCWGTLCESYPEHTRFILETIKDHYPDYRRRTGICCSK